MDNIFHIFSPDGKPVRWYGYDNATGVVDIESREVVNESDYLFEHRCVSCGADSILSARALLMKLKENDIYCSECRWSRPV